MPFPAVLGEILMRAEVDHRRERLSAGVGRPQWREWRRRQEGTTSTATSQPVTRMVATAAKEL